MFRTLRAQFRRWLPPYGFARELHDICARAGLEPPRHVPESSPEADGVRTIWSLRDDLRQAFPLGLTPHQRADYAHWLLTEGRQQFGFSPEAVAVYLRQLANDPAHGLADAYRWLPDWQQAQPDALTQHGWPTFLEWLAAKYSLPGSWLRNAVRPSAPPRDSRQLGINILAHYRHASGLQVVANQIAAALEAAGHPIARRDLPLSWPYDTQQPTAYQDREEFDISYIQTGALESLPEQYRRAGLYPRRGVYRIAGWAWELAELPDTVLANAELANEIWTPSEFCADAVRTIITDRPVFAMPPGLQLPPIPPLDRNTLGLRETDFVFLFCFDMVSVMERKNPLGLIRAFREAFPEPTAARLILKVSRGKSNPRGLSALLAAANRADIQIIDRVMSREESFSLMAGCDAYVSLHRAEGFGLTVAETMLLGKPVIATDYSATTEFLTRETGFPVKYRLVPVGEGCEPYAKDAEWAEPDEREAARLMRWVYENRDSAREFGARAKASLEKNYSHAAMGRRMLDRLAEIREVRVL